MNNTDKALAELIGVGTDTIKSLTKLLGENYEEIYSILVKEYTFYTITENILTWASLLTFIIAIPTVISTIDYFTYPNDMHNKKIFRVCCTIEILLIFVLLIVIILSPALSPNIHIIKELRG